MATSPAPLNIFFFALDGVGHLNACVGMAQALAKRGHRIHCLLNERFKGRFDKFGFEEILLRPPPHSSELQKKKKSSGIPVKQLVKLGLLSPKTPLEKLKAQSSVPSMVEPLYHALVEFNPQIGDAIGRMKPDLFVLGHFLMPPAVPQAAIPWMYLFSGNPLTLFQSDKLPPFGAGFPTASDPSKWEEFIPYEKERFNRNFVRYQKDLNRHFNYTSEDTVPTGTLARSPYLNIYGYPEELDYHDIVPRPDKQETLLMLMRFVLKCPNSFNCLRSFAVNLETTS